MQTEETELFLYHEMNPILTKYGQRPFYHTETMRVLKPFHRMCWGANTFLNILDKEYPDESVCFHFKHTGMKMKGIVAIYLGWEDLYQVRFFEKKDDKYFERKELFQQSIYASDLSTVIDKTIEF